MPRPRQSTKGDFGSTLAAADCASAWAFDEGRFGLKVWFRRRWCPVGVRPPWIVEDRYAWRWLYVAVEPHSGHSFCLLLPGVDSACLGAFLDAFARHVDGQRIGLVLDGSGSHRARDVAWPAGIVPLTLPPYSPELNPAEQVFRHLRASLSNRIFDDLSELDAAIADTLSTFWDEPATLRQLTGFEWWLDGLESILPLTT
jgi:transposase